MYVLENKGFVLGLYRRILILPCIYAVYKEILSWNSFLETCIELPL